MAIVYTIRDPRIKPDISEYEDYTRFIHSRYFGCVLDVLMSDGPGLASGGTIRDWSRFQAKGTLNANATVEIHMNPYQGFGASYRGNNNASGTRLTFSDAPQYDITGELTLTTWIFIEAVPDGAGNQGVLSKYIKAGNNRSYDLAVIETGGNVAVRFGIAPNGTTTGSNFFNSTTTLPLQQWVMITGTFLPSASMKIFINGRLDAEDTTGIPANAFNGSGDVYIGSQFDDLATNSFDGYIAQSRIYNRILSDAEILSLYTDPYLEYREPIISLFGSTAPPIGGRIMSKLTGEGGGLVGYGGLAGQHGGLVA